MNVFWEGFHSASLRDKIRTAWNTEELLVIYPPGYLASGNADPILDFLPGGKRAPVYPEKPILGVFTSGTVSGQRKLVLYSKKNIEFSLTGIRSFFDIGKFDTIFCYPQPFHTFGLILGYLQAELFGLKLVTVDGKYSRRAHEKRLSLNSHSVLTLGTPAHFYDLKQYLKDQSQKLSPSYSCILGGAKVSVALWKSVQDELLIEAPSIGYGATEACPGLTHLQPGLCPKEEGEIGSTIPGVHLKLTESGVHFTGPNVCLAIITTGAERQISFPTSIALNDSVRKRNDGIMVYEGRSDLIMNRGGTKLSLELIEETLRHQKTIESICVPLPDDRLGEELGVLFKTNPDSMGDFANKRANLHDFLKASFGHSFDPRRFHEIETLPMNESLKLDRNKAREILLSLPS